MNWSPARIRAAFLGSITGLSAPGSPRPVPLITIDPGGTSLRSGGASARAAGPVGSESIVLWSRARSSPRVSGGGAGGVAAADVTGAGDDSRPTTGAMATGTAAVSRAP
jgi:hypothetical protein